MSDRTENVHNRRGPNNPAASCQLVETATGYEDESDIMETSALDGTSENNDDHESYDLDSDSDSPINRLHNRAKHNINNRDNDEDSDLQRQHNLHEASSKHLNDSNRSQSPILRRIGSSRVVVDGNKKKADLSTSPGSKFSGATVGGGGGGGGGGVPASTTANPVFHNSASSGCKVSGTKLISRRERSYRRHRNINLNEYDHDGDIDKSDNDDDDDDDDDDDECDGDKDYDDCNIDNNNNTNGDHLLAVEESLYGKDGARFRTTIISNCTINRRRQDKQQVYLRSRMRSFDRVGGGVGAPADVENTSYGSEEDSDHYREPSHLGHHDHHHNHNNNNKSRSASGHQSNQVDGNNYYSKYNIDPSQSKISARCSELRQSLSSSSSSSSSLSLPSAIYSRILTIFKGLINITDDNSTFLEASTTNPPVFELQKKCPPPPPPTQSATKYRKASFDTSKSSSIEWQRSMSLGSHPEIMPNNYGSNTRYQQFHGVDEQQQQQQPYRASGSRRSSSHRKSRETFGSSRRASQNGYAKLGYYHHHNSSKQSLLQELKRILLLLVIIGICAVILWQIYLALDADSNYLGVVTSNSKLGQYNEYAVATDAWPCAQVGKSLLAKGGHAVDAAIGTLICMGVALPNSLGLGGGCLMTIYDNQTKQALTVDGREIAPDYASENMFINNSLAASRGPLSVGVPGELAAYWEAHKRFGKLKWSQLFDESIEMAEKGSPMVEHLAYAFRDWSHAKYVTQPLKDIFWDKETNDYHKEGDIVKQPALAESLKRIRDNGVDEFYNGITGQLFVDDLVKQGGQMTMDNLRKYKPIVKPALDVKIDNDLRLYTQSIPGSGVVLSLILRVMKELGYFKNGETHDSYEAASLFYHHLAEAFKFAYAQRAGLEDNPDEPRMIDLMNKLLSEEFVHEIASKIDNKTHPSDYYGGSQYFQEDHGTAHTSVIDSMGNSVAVTTSVNLYFGSGLVSPSTGIIYNDVMDDFVSPGVSNKFMLPPSKYNRIKPGRRPLSSMAPSVFVNGAGNPILIVGASGGAKITTAVATVALRNVFLGENLKAAIDAPRIHHQYLPDSVWYESNFPPELLESLKLRGHQLQKITGRSSVVMAVGCNYLDHLGHDISAVGQWPNGDNNTTTTGARPKPMTKLITANSDYRKGGTVDGL